MEDFFAAGGIGAVLRELQAAAPSRLPDGDRRDARRAARSSEALTSTATSSPPRRSRSSRMAAWSRCSARSRPRGAILKRSAADSRSLRAGGRAVVFSSLEDLAARIDDPDLDVTPDDFWCCRMPGRSAPRACRRPAICRSRRSSPRGRQGHGPHFRCAHVRHRLRHHRAACDAGAAIGGPLALVRNGDRIRLSVRTDASTCWWTRRSSHAPSSHRRPRDRNAQRGLRPGSTPENIRKWTKGCDFAV